MHGPGKPPLGEHSPNIDSWDMQQAADVSPTPPLKQDMALPCPTGACKRSTPASRHPPHWEKPLAQAHGALPSSP